jgi:Leucine-rich repeat (LRR) protein
VENIGHLKNLEILSLQKNKIQDVDPGLLHLKDGRESSTTVSPLLSIDLSNNFIEDVETLVFSYFTIHIVFIGWLSLPSPWLQLS